MSASHFQSHGQTDQNPGRIRFSKRPSNILSQLGTAKNPKQDRNRDYRPTDPEKDFFKQFLAVSTMLDFLGPGSALNSLRKTFLECRLL